MVSPEVLNTSYNTVGCTKSFRSATNADLVPYGKNRTCLFQGPCLQGVLCLGVVPSHDVPHCPEGGGLDLGLLVAEEAHQPGYEAGVDHSLVNEMTA